MRPMLPRALAFAPALPALAATGLMLLWAAHDGGYDADTWYWGALVVLGLLVALVAVRSSALRELSRTTRGALVALGLYVAWSYLSIAWAGSPGDALTGSNRALLYLLVFALFALTPWTPRRGLAVVLAYALGVGTIAAIVLIKLTTGGHVATGLFGGGRLFSPTGYFNASAALFTSNALLSTQLAARRELPAALRGLLVAIGCGCLQLALLAQSRGWLFTLPIVIVIAVLISRDRLRVCATAALPIAGLLASLSRLLHVFQSASSTASVADAAGSSGRTCLLLCAAVLAGGTLIAAGERRITAPSLTARTKRILGLTAVALALVAAGGGAAAATHGHPFRFIAQQWHGFTHPTTAASGGSHFATVGSGRYDFWRVSLDAFLAHPLSGLGQDNFADYYVTRRRTGEEPSWTHSLEMRFLAHTGLVGLALFGAFLIAALRAAMRVLHGRDRRSAVVVSIALMPLVVWLIHGSVDWFWEMPALSGPALGFLGMGAVVAPPEGKVLWRRDMPAWRTPRLLAATAVALTCLAAVVLWFSYLSVREISVASDIAASDPRAALSDLATAADLNPLSAEPGRLAGTIALQAGLPGVAESRFKQAIAREPGGWFAWLGAGLAASALGDRASARADFVVAARINTRQPAIAEALSRVDGKHPLTPAQALRALIYAR
jgi:hypothetical protein